MGEWLVGNATLRRAFCWLAGSLAVCLLTVGFMVVPQGAAAGVFTACGLGSPDATNKLLDNDGCVLVTGIVPNDNAQPDAGDLAGMFGQTPWLEIAKIDAGATGSAPGNTMNGFTFASANGNASGTWSVAQSILDAWTYVAIVMKDGNHKPAATIAYLISDLDGTWSTPWENCNGKKGCKPVNALSNATLWVSGATIPLPAAAWLMLAGLGGLGLMSRRKAKVA
jgi:hypothetical protein